MKLWLGTERKGEHATLHLAILNEQGEIIIMLTTLSIILIADHKVRRQARKMMQRDHQSVAKSVLEKRGRNLEEREAVQPGLNQEIQER